MMDSALAYPIPTVPYQLSVKRAAGRQPSRAIRPDECDGEPLIQREPHAPRRCPERRSHEPGKHENPCKAVSSRSPCFYFCVPLAASTVESFQTFFRPAFCYEGMYYCDDRSSRWSFCFRRQARTGRPLWVSTVGWNSIQME
jgi:hypothetical protein